MKDMIDVTLENQIDEDPEWDEEFHKMESARLAKLEEEWNNLNDQERQALIEECADAEVWSIRFSSAEFAAVYESDVLRMYKGDEEAALEHINARYEQVEKYRNGDYDMVYKHAAALVEAEMVKYKDEVIDPDEVLLDHLLTGE